MSTPSRGELAPFAERWAAAETHFGHHLGRFVEFRFLGEADAALIFTVVDRLVQAVDALYDLADEAAYYGREIPALPVV